MKRFKIIKKHHDLKKGTVVIDEGISEPETEMHGVEYRAVLIEGAAIPLTYIIPSEKLQEIND